jgi:hypothetical protein
MADDRSPLVRELDAQIGKLEGLAATAQGWANRLSGLSNDLAVLKRARALMMDPESAGQSHALVYVPITVGSAVGYVPTEAEQPSIGALILAVLKEAGTPMKVQTILERIQAKGRPDLTLKTLGGVLAQYLAKKLLRRTKRATYALPVDEVSV